MQYPRITLTAIILCSFRSTAQLEAVNVLCQTGAPYRVADLSTLKFKEQHLGPAFPRLGKRPDKVRPLIRGGESVYGITSDCQL